MTDVKDKTVNTWSSRPGAKAATAGRPDPASAASAPLLRPFQTPDKQSHAPCCLPPSSSALLPPPSEQPPRHPPILIPIQQQQHQQPPAMETSVFRLTYQSRQIFPVHAPEMQLAEERSSAATASASAAGRQRLQHDASKQACIKEMGCSAAVTRLDVTMSRLRNIYFGILEEQLLNEALLAAGSDADDLRVVARGGGACCCGDRLSPRVPFSAHDLGPRERGPSGKRACVHCGAPPGRHHRVTQTNAGDRALLLDPQLLPRLMHAYERNHALIVQDLREALARVEEAAGVGGGGGGIEGGGACAPAGGGGTGVAMAGAGPAAGPRPKASPLLPLLPRPDVCPKECFPPRCPMASASGVTANPGAAVGASPAIASPAPAPLPQKTTPPPSPKPLHQRRPTASWWRRLLCISADDDA